MSWFWQGLLLLIFTVPVIVLFGYAAWDVIRRHDAGLLVRALWLVAFCVLPIIGLTALAQSEQRGSQML